MKRSAPLGDKTHQAKRLRSDAVNEDQHESKFVGFGWLLETEAFSDVKLIVGSGEGTVEFKLHKVIITNNSGYFRRALKSNTFKEGNSNQIELEHHDPNLVSYMVHWLYNGQAPKPQNPKHSFSLPFILRCIDTAVYFDVPSLLHASIEDCVANLNRPTHQRHYIPGRKLEDSFIEGMSVLFKLYPTQSKTLDPVVRAMCDNNRIPLIMNQPELRRLLQGVPELMMRMIEIQAGMDTTEVDDEEGGGSFDENSDNPDAQ